MVSMEDGGGQGRGRVWDGGLDGRRREARLGLGEARLRVDCCVGRVWIEDGGERDWV